jgi:biotin synthase-related radical SAM superfamily protein
MFMTTMTDYKAALATKKRYLLSDLQSRGLRLIDPSIGAPSRIGGAGPTDHKAITVLGTTIMVPVHTRSAASSPYTAASPNAHGISLLRNENEEICEISFPPPPKFYALSTEEGIPYWKIAQLHSRDTLATTVLQTCVRYGNSKTKCQFCAIGESLRSGRTIAKKSAAQLAEVASAAKRLDGVRNVVLTTGSPPTDDRGASVLAEVADAIKRQTHLPIQAQCEPPADFVWFERLHQSGVDSLAFVAAVAVFGRGQVSTYLLAGLGDTIDDLHEAARNLIDLGVYPFIVPFVPVGGTPLASHRPPPADFMRKVLEPVGAWLLEAGITSDKVKAGCSKCAACSTLSVFEKETK